MGRFLLWRCRTKSRLTLKQTRQWEWKAMEINSMIPIGQSKL